jgi:hypothetical protein
LFRRLDGASNPPTQEIIGSSVIARGSGERSPDGAGQPRRQGSKRHRASESTS